MKIYLLAIMMSFVSHAYAQGQKYFGATNVEAKLEYQAKIEINHAGKLSLSSLKRENANNEHIFEEVRNQISHLIGHFSSQSFKEEVGFPGVLGEKIDFTFTKVENQSKQKILHYKASGKIVFHKSVFKSKKVAEIPLRMPLSAERTYELGMVGGKNRCTDPHYNDIGDFFYFWDIDQEGCPLRGDDKEIVRVKAKLTQYENTKKTYPEYDRLYEKDVLDIRILMGYIGDSISLTNVNYKDDGYVSYKGKIDELKTGGFKISEQKTKFRLTRAGDEIKGVNYLTTMTKQVKNQLGRTQTVQVTLYLGDTDLGTEDATFHQILIPAFQEADILVYDGHSGLGANLGFDYLPEFTFDTTGKYQLFFINGCSSYPYFNGQFFRNKEGGSKNIDIITSGLSTYTYTSVTNTMAFIAPFIDGRLWSYQTLLRHMEVSNGDAGTYLTGVNGDEDNQFLP